MRRMKDKIEGSITNADYANSAGSVAWDNVSGKPGTFTPTAHTHDDRYYTEAEVDGKLSEKENSQVLTTVTDVNTLKTTGIYHCNNAMTNNATSNHGTLYVDFSVGTPYQIWMPDNQNTAYKRTFSGDAWKNWTQLKFTDTNTWRGIQNNLTSDSTDQSLSAAQGKALKGLVDGKAPASHTHTKSQITDFPTSMPASDVSAWAKAATKPSYTKAEVGLSNVDNTADKDKSVKFATNAAMANKVEFVGTNDLLQFSGTGIISDTSPAWVFGGENVGTTVAQMFDPSNFSVKYAESAGSAGNGVVAFDLGVGGLSGYMRFDNGIQICWAVGYSGDASGSFKFAQKFLKTPCIMLSGTGAYRYAFYVTNASSTSFDYCRDGSGSSVSPQYIAIGQWK